MTDRGIAHLVNHPELETLNLRSLNVTDVGLEYLAALHKLEMIVFSKPEFTKAGLERLQRRLVLLRCGG